MAYDKEAFSSVGDIMPTMGMFDVCISNGAFCLVPDKHGAFGSVYWALKSKYQYSDDE
jgi:hypothetical protein